MAMLTFHAVSDSFLEYFIKKATPTEILAYKVSEAEMERTVELLDKQDEGTLTEDEAEELGMIRQMDLLIMGLQADALMALHDGK